MEFNYGNLNEEISIFFIDDFDISNLEDRVRLKTIFKRIFPKGNTLFFSFRREENLTSDEELKRLRIKILDIFNSEGEYLVIRKLDDVRFDSVGRLAIDDNTYNFLFDLWSYFYSCTFFVPKGNLTLSDYISFQKKNKLTDIGNEKLLNQDFAEVTCIKGLGGDNMIVSYRRDYDLQDLMLGISYINVKN